MGDMSLLGVTADEQYGGAAMDYLEHVIAMEEISRASASMGSYGAHSILHVNQIRRDGSEGTTRRRRPVDRVCFAGVPTGDLLPRRCSSMRTTSSGEECFPDI